MGPTLTKRSPSEEADNFEVSEVFIAKKISFGMHLQTLQEQKYIQHFCKDVVSGSLADQFELKDKDELLMVNSNGVIDRTHEEVLDMFASLKTAEPITLITRRHLGLDKTEENNKKVDYIRTIGKIVKEKEHEKFAGKLHVHIILITYSKTGIIPVGEKEPVYIKCKGPSGFLKFDGGKLSFKPGLHDSSDAYKFDILRCIDITKLRRRIISSVHIIEAYGKKIFLNYNNDGSVTMEERNLDDKGMPVKLEGLLLQPTDLSHRQKYHVYEDETRNLVWDNAEGVRVEKRRSPPDGQPKFLFEIFDIKEE